MNLGNVSASRGSSCAGLCSRKRPGRFRCGDHGVTVIACKAFGTHRAGSWRRQTARLLITPPAVPTRCSSLSVSRRNQKLVTHGYWSWLTLAPGQSSVYLFSRWQDLLPLFLSTNLLVRCHTSQIVHGSIGECVVTPKKREFVVEKLPDMRGQDSALWRRLSPRRRCSDDCVGNTWCRICQSCPSRRHYLGNFVQQQQKNSSLSPCRHKR